MAKKKAVTRKKRKKRAGIFNMTLSFASLNIIPKNKKADA